MYACYLDLRKVIRFRICFLVFGFVYVGTTTNIFEKEGRRNRAGKTFDAHTYVRGAQTNREEKPRRFCACRSLAVSLCLLASSGRGILCCVPQAPGMSRGSKRMRVVCTYDLAFYIDWPSTIRRLSAKLLPGLGCDRVGPIAGVLLVWLLRVKEESRGEQKSGEQSLHTYIHTHRDTFWRATLHNLHPNSSLTCIQPAGCSVMFLPRRDERIYVLHVLRSMIAGLAIGTFNER